MAVFVVKREPLFTFPLNKNNMKVYKVFDRYGNYIGRPFKTKKEARGFIIMNGRYDWKIKECNKF